MKQFPGASVIATNPAGSLCKRVGGVYCARDVRRRFVTRGGRRLGFVRLGESGLGVGWGGWMREKHTVFTAQKLGAAVHYGTIEEFLKCECH